MASRWLLEVAENRACARNGSIARACNEAFRAAWRDERRWRALLEAPLRSSQLALGADRVRQYQGFNLIAAQARLLILRDVRREARRALRAGRVE